MLAGKFPSLQEDRGFGERGVFFMAEKGKGGAAEALLRIGNHLTRSKPLDGTRAQVRAGGRQGDVFYRDRWSHDKIVRSTHGVNCTGSCAWDVYEIGRASCRESGWSQVGGY